MLGLSERFEMHELSPRCAGEFEGIFERFCDRIADHAFPGKPRERGLNVPGSSPRKVLHLSHTLFTVDASGDRRRRLRRAVPDRHPKEGGERVPLSICGYDRSIGSVSFAFHEVGKTTKELGTFSEGDELFNVTGPLGNPSEIRKYGKVLCVGGSIMIAPALLQAKALKEAGNEVVTVSGLSQQEFPFQESGSERYSDRVYVASDDGTVGEKGWTSLGNPEQGRFDRARSSGRWSDEEGQ